MSRRRALLATGLGLVTALGALVLPASPASAEVDLPPMELSPTTVAQGESFTLRGSGCFGPLTEPWNPADVSVFTGWHQERVTPDSYGNWVLTVDVQSNDGPGYYEIEADCNLTEGDGLYERIRITVIEKNTFSDVPVGAPFARDIEWLKATFIATGDQRGTFRPNAPVIRQAMAVFLHNFANPGNVRLSAPAIPPDPVRCWIKPYSDVPSKSPYCGSIQWLSGNDITKGTASGGFQPLSKVTRQQMAVFLYKLEHGHSPPTCTSDAFADVPKSSWYCGSIKWLSTTGLTTSSPSGNFDPTGTVTRGMMAAFLHRHAAQSNARG